MDKEFGMPENWEQMIGLVSDLMAENKGYKDGWAAEVIQQSKKNTRNWFIAFLVTFAALFATNAYWIYTFQSYDYVSQDGEGINNYNVGHQGDLTNGTEN